MVFSGALTLGELVLFGTYFNQLVGPVRMYSRLMDFYQDGLVSARRVFEVLDVGRDVPESAHPIELPRLKGNIEFRGVSFSYGGASEALSDIDLVDVHEAFCAQVLCVLRAMASGAFARKHLGVDKAAGERLPEDINVHGGSVALGHPFGATGVRMVITMANELRRSGKETALLSICAAGGQSAGAVLRAVR